MTVALVDTNILIDLIDDDPVHGLWSETALIEAASHHDLCANIVVAAELASTRKDSMIVAEQLQILGISLLDIPLEAAINAGRAYRAYRQRGGGRERILADFLIGGHASVLGAVILTRDPKRYRSYFPDLTFISPETQP
jgi:predicted nucleic acid-binding protein